MSKDYKEALGVSVDDPEDMLAGTQVSFGLKTSQGLVANISSDESPAADVAVTERDGSDLHRAAVGEHAAQKTVSVGRRKSVPRRQETQAQPEPAQTVASKPVRVELSVGVLGTIPSQYSGYSIGNRCVILDLNEYSFTPAVADSMLQPVITMDITGSREFIYLGQWWEDKGLNRHIILNEITKENN